MFSEEIINLITKGCEETNLEYKDSMTWKDPNTRLKIIQAMLALSNNKDGGAIIIGVKEEISKNFNPHGMSVDDFNSFNYDTVSQIVREYSDPLIEFKLLGDTANIDNEDRNFVVIQVGESAEPVICIKFGLYTKDGGHHPQNIALRKNAIYIRSKAPIESREIATIHEWRELIERSVQKNKLDLLKKLPCSTLINKPMKVDSSKFDQDLNTDKL